MGRDTEHEKMRMIADNDEAAARPGKPRRLAIERRKIGKVLVGQHLGD